MRWPLLILTLLVAGCTSSKKVEQSGSADAVADVMPVFEPGPHVMVYRTKADLREHVPVLMSADGKDIVSYPHPSDLSAGGELRVPTPLEKGYLLDNRGINQHVAFLKLTYGEYAKLQQAPSLAEMQQMIVAREPLTELCDCGLRSAFTDIEAQLNRLIASGKLRGTCRVIL